MRDGAKILVVDDEKGVRDACITLLRKSGYAADGASSGTDALQLIELDRDLGIVITDVRMPEMSGIDLLKRIKERRASIEVIVVTGHGSIEGAVEAIQLGAADYIAKPFTREKLIAAIEKVLQVRSLHQEVDRLRSELQEKYRFDGIIGHSATMLEVFERMSRACVSESTVIVLGESGTGKELVARAIHYQSGRAKGPFVPVNCAALPKELIESELFGHKKGAFTGATADSVGLIRAASGGTLFLDEVSEIPLGAQAKLLRFLQEKTVRPVGGTDETHVDVRVIAASNLDLEAAVKKNLFRQDLYYRLNVITVHLPSLRERPEDVPLLVTHFLAKLNKSNKRAITGLDRDAMEALRLYAWPGNVRELENAIESAFAFCSGDRIGRTHLPRYLQAPAEARGEMFGGSSAVPTLKEAQKILILKALRVYRGNKSKAAKSLGISRKRFYRWLEEYHIPVDEGKGGEDEE